MKIELKEKIKSISNKRIDLFKEFLDSEKSSGYLLICITVLSLSITNSSLGIAYSNFWHTHIDLSFGNIFLNFSLSHWINDGLMTIFFLLVGLEIEREIYEGELSSIKKASLPVIAAFGGMLLPALIHISFNINTVTQKGFGIPIATDIAFALGVLSIIGKRIPVALKIFLTALAIIDDLGAIVVIAMFYTNTLSIAYLIGSLGIFSILLLMKKANVKKLTPYLLLGAVMWYLMLQSGVHATISGVLLAFAIPFRRNSDSNISYSLQKWLHKPVAFIILPLFALANTSIILPNNIIVGLTTHNSIGIIAGLVLGKLIGVFLFSYLAVKVGFSSLPVSLNWNFIFGASALAGIGFTMSIFITNLAFSNNELVTTSKLSIMVASTISALLGILILKIASRISHLPSENNFNCIDQ